MVCLVALSFLLALAAGATPAQAQALKVWRNIYNPERPVDQRPQRALPSGPGVEVRDEVWTVRGARRLRITSPDAEVSVVMRFRPLPGGKPGQLRLTVVLIVDPALLEYQYKMQGQALEGGKLVERKVFRLGPGRETELSGEPGAVGEVEIQDDARAELRLRLDGQTLELQVIPPDAGGQPTGGVLTYYHGRPLTFLDYSLLAAGYTNNAYGELFLWHTLALRLNGNFGGDKRVWLGRAVVTQQLWRNAHYALWVEGGAAAYRIEEVNLATTVNTVTWTAGVTGHVRYGDWGAAAHYATVDGPAAMSVLAGWQATHTFGVALGWHTFKGLSATAIGLTVAF